MVYRRCERAGRGGWRVELGAEGDAGARPYRVGWLPRSLSQAPGRVRATGAAALAMGTTLVPGLVACVMIPVAVGHSMDAVGPWARGLVGGLACLVWIQAALATPALALFVGGELLSRRGDAHASAELLGFAARLSALALTGVATAVLVLSRAPNRWVLSGIHLGVAALWLSVGALVRITARDYGALWAKRALADVDGDEHGHFERVHISP